ncbi:MAG: CDP-alcohol phosphatidyltransferase family protein [Gammaproteobacteria bacterium]|nr:CDP-alcohol phosphatidyltransferase family protein [Gammaproteobacteria bacterium]MBI5617678.1 CDP-alcohol phosphatidyltransferase family protein [Gammaproteobacteria bacterium]
MAHNSWTHRLARAAIRPLLGTSVTPNQLTTARLVTGLLACAAFALGTRDGEIWGGIIWVLSAFLDRADGELARLGNMMSPQGHAYDYACDVACNGLVFFAIGIGLRDSPLGAWAILMGLVAGITVTAASLWSESLERQLASGRKAYEGAGGFDFDDILYAFGPVAWAGWLMPLLVGASLGGPVFAVLTWVRLRQARVVAS